MSDDETTEDQEAEPRDPMRELEHDSIPTPEEALEALGRYNNSHFRGRLGNDAEAETARYSIPANHKRDDDLRLSAFIRWAGRQAREVEVLRARGLHYPAPLGPHHTEWVTQAYAHAVERKRDEAQAEADQLAVARIRQERELERLQQLVDRHVAEAARARVPMAGAAASTMDVLADLRAALDVLNGELFFPKAAEQAEPDPTIHAFGRGMPEGGILDELCGPPLSDEQSDPPPPEEPA